jgi:hypothetical protein
LHEASWSVDYSATLGSNCVIQPKNARDRHLRCRRIGYQVEAIIYLLAIETVYVLVASLKGVLFQCGNGTDRRGAVVHV